MEKKTYIKNKKYKNNYTKVSNNHQNYITMNKKPNKRNKNLIYKKFNNLLYKIAILLIRVIKIIIDCYVILEAV